MGATAGCEGGKGLKRKGRIEADAQVSNLGDPDRYMVPFTKVWTATARGEAETGSGLYMPVDSQERCALALGLRHGREWCLQS